MMRPFYYSLADYLTDVSYLVAEKGIQSADEITQMRYPN